MKHSNSQIIRLIPSRKLQLTFEYTPRFLAQNFKHLSMVRKFYRKQDVIKKCAVVISKPIKSNGVLNCNLNIRYESKNLICHPAAIKTSNGCFINIVKHRSMRDVQILHESKQSNTTTYIKHNIKPKKKIHVACQLDLQVVDSQTIEDLKSMLKLKNSQQVLQRTISLVA